MYLVYNEQTGDFEEKLYKYPPELSFNMANSGNSVFKGDKVHLTWSTKDAEIVTLNGEEMPNQMFSQEIICVNTGLRDFILVASNPCGETRKVISVSVIDKPSFNISCSRPKLRRGKNENCELRWNIRFALSVTLTTPEGKNNVEPSGVIILSPAESEVLVFEALAIDNVTSFSKEIKIGVYDESVVQFEADKEFVFPSLPVVLSWNVTKAIKVWLNTEEIEPIGSKIVEPTSDTIYILRAKDEFGVKEERVTVRTIPIKQMKVLLASPPNFTIKQSFTFIRPQFNVDVKLPSVDIDWIRLKVPKVKSFKELGLSFELSPPLPTSSFSFKKAVKKVYNQIIRK